MTLLRQLARFRFCFSFPLGHEASLLVIGDLQLLKRYYLCFLFNRRRRDVGNEIFIDGAELLYCMSGLKAVLAVHVFITCYSTMTSLLQLNVESPPRLRTLGPQLVGLLWSVTVD